MDIRQSFLAMIKAFPGGWDAMSAALGMSRDALENRIYERKGQGVLVETARQMYKFSDTDFFAEAIAADRGGVFLKLPAEIDDGNEEMWIKAQNLQIEIGRFFDHVKEFTGEGSDGVLDKREEAQLAADEARIHRAMAELHALVKRIYKQAPAKVPA